MTQIWVGADKTIHGLDDAARERLRAVAPDLFVALDEIAITVGYIVTHVTLGEATADIEDGPRVRIPSMPEIGQCIQRIGRLANDAMRKVED